MGADRTAKEGDPVAMSAAVVDPLGRTGEPFSFRWEVVRVAGDSAETFLDAPGGRSLSWPPPDNGVSARRETRTETERARTGFPAPLFIPGHNVAPALEGARDQPVREGKLLTTAAVGARV